jgi:hypothetical protein
MRSKRASLPSIVASVLAGLSVLAGRGAAGDATTDCRTHATAVREALETVAESVIDGRPARVPAAVKKATGLWVAHREMFSETAGVDSMMNLLDATSRRRAANATAGLAVQAAVASFRWCPGEATLDDRLFLIDLTGMAAWLRTRGVRIAWPPDVHGATEAVASELDRRKRGPLAVRLRSSVATVLTTRERPGGDPRSANQLLALVDDIEKALR